MNEQELSKFRQKLAAAVLLKGGGPTSYDRDGWRDYLADFDKVKAVSNMRRVTTEGAWPSADASAKALHELVTPPESHSEALDRTAFILTDASVLACGDSLDRQAKLWRRVMKTINDEYLPAHYLTMPHSVLEFLKTMFIYTTGDDGKRIVYWRDLSKPGMVWYEGDGDHPFKNLHGAIKETLNGLLAVHYNERCVNVLRLDANGKPYTQHAVNLADLYHECAEDILADIEKTEAKVAYKWFVSHMRDHMEELRTGWRGTNNKFEQETGLKALPQIYEDLEDKLDFCEELYRKTPGIVNFTNDPTVDTFTYFDLNSLHEGPTPGFDMFLSGVAPECRDTLMSAMFATFYAESQLNQYIWLHGEGGDGKSSLLNAMKDFIGPSMYCTLDSDSAKSEFGLEETVGKRLVMFPDIQGGLSVKSSIVHKLTGHDVISINRKNKPHISAKIDCILWMAANSAPDVNFSNNNESRRVVYIKMQEPSLEVQRKIFFLNDDGSFQLDAEGKKINNGFPLLAMMTEEMPCILYKCRDKFFSRVQKPYSVIRRTLEESRLASNNCVDQEDDSLQFIIDEAFDFSDKEAKLSNTEIIEKLNMSMKDHNLPQLNLFTRNAALRKLRVVFNCVPAKSNGIRYLYGIKLKNSFGTPVPPTFQQPEQKNPFDLDEKAALL